MWTKRKAPARESTGPTRRALTAGSRAATAAAGLTWRAAASGGYSKSRPSTAATSSASRQAGGSGARRSRITAPTLRSGASGRDPSASSWMLSETNSGLPAVRACRSSASTPSRPAAVSQRATLSRLSPDRSHRRLPGARARLAITLAARDEAVTSVSRQVTIIPIEAGHSVSLR